MLERVRDRLRRLLAPRTVDEVASLRPAARPEAVALAVHDWSDEQLRRAWDVSTHRLEAGEQVAPTVAMRALLLDEWARRHPGAVDAWWPGRPPRR